MTSVRRNCGGRRGRKAMAGLPRVCSRSPTRWRDGPCERGAAGRDGPADLARLGSSLQRGRDCRAQQPTAAGALAEVDGRPDGGAEGGGADWARPGSGRGGALAHCRSVPLGGGALGRHVQRDRDAAAVVVTGPVAPQDPAAPSANRREGAASLQKGGFAARLSEIARAHPEAERFEIWSQDEARVGQKGRTGYVWWQRGQTPRGLRDVGHQSAWIIGAVCPARDTGVALVMTRIDTAAMNLFLAELGQAVAPGAHGIVLMDKAGWHTSSELRVPENLSLVFLPPYSPELNPIERLWLHLRDNRLSHCVFQTTERIVDSCCEAWNWLLAETGRIRSLCSYPWLQQVSS